MIKKLGGDIEDIKKDPTQTLKDEYYKVQD